MLSEQTENVRSSRENKGWISQMRVFVFTIHHKESKMKMKLMFTKKLAENSPCAMHLSFRYVQNFLSSLLHTK